MSLRRIVIGVVLAIVALAGATAPASAAVQSIAGVQETQEFQGDGVGTTRAAAITMARSDANAQAVAAGFRSTLCRTVSSSAYFDGDFYLATVTISCSR
ncbi:hypothetical protein IMZ11_05290 [Microtetraspora sp. AC03309]|uniref:hypothetical protein n=1 Tax=Microtetraspora sp. AC03309 TaxID=2779376 RepID=UPI001E2F608D|nr:hypothetical protein [Microtetraspora sp. AC03309]MCC5575053.1 hypothetical protein [Microtetraspora sp. AC03309]